VINDGGTAFPSVESPPEYEGMRLRDYFAAKAMQAMCAGDGARQVADRDERYDETNWSFIVATNAYEMADAMLLARLNETKGPSMSKLTDLPQYREQQSTPEREQSIIQLFMDGLPLGLAALARHARIETAEALLRVHVNAAAQEIDRLRESLRLAHEREEGLRECILHLSPSHTVPGTCWCPIYHDIGGHGHTKACLKAQQALQPKEAK
jgi:hypothetical protein